MRTIEIVPDALGCGYDVLVKPPVPDEPLDGEFRDYRNARAWADGLHRTRGWPIHDRTGGAHA